jgi:long-chain fatty acid transport protein
MSFMRKPKFYVLTSATALFLLAFSPASAFADGLYRNGVGARAMALGGADAAWAEDPLGAMGANPAGLGLLTAPELNVGAVGAVTLGHFTKSTNSDGHLSTTPNGFPEAAFAMPLGKSPVSFGISFIPDSVMSANWHYADPPGGLGGATSYGFQQDKSEINVFRSAAGLGVSLGDHWSLGGSVGLLYNENTLVTPYVFQTQPALKGAKTLLDLNTSGFGWDGQVGVLFRPVDVLQFGVTYKSGSRVSSHGDASGNAGTQFGAPGAVPFHYDAEVINHFPQMVTAGLSWKFQPKWRLALQVDWIDWSGAFSRLPVNLSNGNNATVNGLVGSSSLQDSIPLEWRSEFVYRGGVEYHFTDNFVARGGYSYGRSPVPDATLTPMTAAIMEHTVTAGLGYHWKRYQCDLAYQWDIPVTRNVGTSSLLAGEYSNSSTQVAIHWLALTFGVRF